MISDAASRARFVGTASMASCASVFKVAQQAASLTGPEADALRRLYSFTIGTARCTVGAELGAKYNMAVDNQQEVVSVTNVLTQEQTWCDGIAAAWGMYSNMTPCCVLYGIWTGEWQREGEGPLG